MKNCNLHKDPRPHVCHDCARDEARRPDHREPIKLQVTDDDRMAFRIVLGDGKGKPTSLQQR